MLASLLYLHWGAVQQEFTVEGGGSPNSGGATGLTGAGKARPTESAGGATGITGAGGARARTGSGGSGSVGGSGGRVC